MDDSLAPGYTVRAPRPDEAAAVHALIVATETAESGEVDPEPIDVLRDNWRKLDLERDAWVVTGADGALAGYAHAWERRHVRIDVEGYVDPAHQGRGVGTRLIRAAEARADEHLSQAPPAARVVVNNWINSLNGAARDLLEREGYALARAFWQMRIGLDQPPPAPVWPAGITVQPGLPEGDFHPYYVTFEEAMADHWGHVPVSFDDWQRRYSGQEGFDPSLWFLAREGDDPVGAARCSLSEESGWVDTLAVRAPWRRRGIGEALLRHAFGEFHRRGAHRAGLGVDAASPTGATRLYERAGMRVVEQYATYSKELRPGVELAAPDEDA